jgi:hypothetical protein
MSSIYLRDMIAMQLTMTLKAVRNAQEIFVKDWLTIEQYADHSTSGKLISVKDWLTMEETAHHSTSYKLEWFSSLLVYTVQLTLIANCSSVDKGSVSSLLIGRSESQCAGLNISDYRV